MKTDKHISLLMVSLFHFMALTINAQPYIIEKIGINQGFKSNDILCSAQDRNGILYVGTGSGLYRFNGYSFEIFPPKGFADEIAGCSVPRILTDEKSDSLLVIVNNSLKAIHTLNYGMRSYNITFPPLLSRKDETETLIDACFTSDGKLWLLPKRGAPKLFIPNTEYLSSTDIDSELWTNTSRNLCLVCDDSGNLYIGHQGEGLSVYHPNQKTLKHYKYHPKTSGLPGNEVTDIYIDSRRQIWVATHWGLSLFDSDSEKFITFTHDPDNVRSLSDSDIHSLREIDGKLWIGTWRGGVNILDLNNFNPAHPQKTVFEHIVSGDLSTRLSSPSILDIFNDSFGNIWLSSTNSGVNIIPHIVPFFHAIAYSPLREEQNGLSDKAVLSLCHDSKDNLWIGTDNGNIDIYHKSSDATLYEKVKHLQMGGGITFMIADRKEMIWMGIDKIGLIRYNPQNGQSQKIQLGADPYFRTYIYSIRQGQDGKLWIGTHDGLFVCEPDSDKAKSASINYALPIFAIEEDGQKNLWVASDNQILVITPQCQKIKEFSFQSDYINCIYHDSKSRIWIAEGRRLHKVETDNTKEYTLHVVNTTPKWSGNENIRSICEGADGSLWMSDIRRIIHYLPEKEEVQFFDQHEGVPEAIFKTYCSTRIGDMLFFAQQNGICYFDSHHTMHYYALPTPRIIAFITEGSSGQSELPVQSDMRLEHRQNTFTLRCSILDYALKDKIEYAYSFDKEQWYSIAQGNDIIFRNLSHGQYTIYVKARIHNQKWSDNIAFLKVDIAPPLWLTWWAELLYVTACLIFALLIVRYYKRRLQQKNQIQLETQRLEQEQHLNDEKLRFYTNVTHELRTPLTLILGPLEDLEAEDMKPEQTKKISLIHKSARRLYELVNQIMEFRKSETHNRRLNVANADLSALIHEITLKYQELNTNEKVRIDCIAEDHYLLWFDREVVTIILDNILSNALKYTPYGKVEVLLRQLTVDNISYTEISVSDTGHGIPTEALERVFDRYYQADGAHQTYGTGIGLALVKKLVELHQGNISVESEEGKGSTFRFRIRTDNEYPDAIHSLTFTEQQLIEKQVTNSNIPVLLIVEDNKDIRNYIADSFSTTFEILTATNGHEGINVAIERLPDIILSDIMMPVADGIELCETLKKDARTSHIPIILLTARDTENDKTDGYLHGADSYITKPFSIQLLRSRIDNLLKNRRKIAEYFTSGTYKKTVASNAANQLDNEFMERVFAIIEKNISEEQINVTSLAETLNMSYSTFYRKLKALTGITANELIRKVKMQHAEKMLLSRKYTVNEVMLEVGYNSRTAFREAFKAEFGVLPSKYIEHIS